MKQLASQFASDVTNDRLVFEIFEKLTRHPIAELEKKEDGQFELYLPGNIVVDGKEFLQLLQKGIQEL